MVSRSVKKIILIGKIIVIVLPAVLLFWLIKKDLALDGSVEFNYDFNRLSAGITELFPADRVVKNEGRGVRVVAEPVYFEVRLPQTFETAKIELTYQSSDLSLLQLGLRTLHKSTDWNYYFKPFFNRFFDELNWFKIEANNATLWQKEKRFLSFSSFIREINRLPGLAVYFFSDYNRTGKEMIITSTPKDYSLPAEINYLVSAYQTPKYGDDDMVVAKIDFSLTDADVVNRKLRFAISAPELKNPTGTLMIGNIKVSLNKKPLTFSEVLIKFKKYLTERF